MNKKELIDWVYNLPLQTLTDELKEDIVEKIDDLKESNVYRKKFRCYIVDEDDWDETYEVLTQGSLTECVEGASNELERMIEEFDEDREDFKEDLEKVEAFLKNPKEELSKVKEGYKPLYVGAPLGYTISIE